MDLVSVERQDSPQGVRLAGEVRYDGECPAAEVYWFEVPAACGDDLTLSGNPWLVALAPLAVTRQEPLRIGQPVDPTLLGNVRRLMDVWAGWYPQWPAVPVECAIAPTPRPAPAGRTGAFFSGGLDSFYSVLRHAPHGIPPMEAPLLDELLTVWGFDIPLANRAAIVRLEARFQRVASSLGTQFVGVATNLRQLRWATADWGLLAHGCGLAAAGLVLEGRYDTLLIAATGGHRDPHPWGSHPATDPLFSTRATTFLHDGANATRVEKTRFVLDSPIARAELRVCWRSESDENCGECAKCYRTMTILELLDGLGGMARFPNRRVDVGRLARLYCAHPWDYRELRDIRNLARERDRGDIVDAVDRAMRKSDGLRLRLAMVRRLRDWPVLWRWAGALERLLVREWLL